MRRVEGRGRGTSQEAMAAIQWERSGWEWVRAEEVGGVSAFYIHIDCGTDRICQKTGWRMGEERGVRDDSLA